jgi:iron complex outermembrane recepter protein
MKNLLNLLFLFYSVLGVSQSYQGLIIDNETKEPIPFASVWIIDLNTGTSCDINGRFSLEISLPKTIHLKLSSTGYTPITLTIEKNELSNSTFQLSSSHIELQEMEISETTGVLQNYSIINVESKKLDELNTISTTSLGQAIGNISGVYSNSTGNGINKPVIRGLSGMRVSTYLNGLKIENQQWGNDHGIGVDALGINKVEVIKGPSSLLYGSDALGGVLYLKEEEYAKSNTIEAGVSSQFELNTLGTTSGFKFKIAKKNIRFNLFGNLTSHADYQVPTGNYVFNSRFNGQAIKAAFGYNKNNWILNLRYTFLTNQLGIPGHSHDSVPIYDDLFKNTRKRIKTLPLQVNKNHYLSVENKFFFKNSDFKITLGAISHNLQEFEEKVTIPAIDITLNTYSYNGIWSYKKNKKHTLLLGTQGNFQLNKNAPEAEEILLRDLSMTNHGIFFMIHSKWNKKWQTQAGIRGDINHFEGNNSLQFTEEFNENYRSINYSLGASYVKKNHSFRANISSGYRPPHPIETLANGVHHASRRFQIGSINLHPEYASQLDISYEYSNEHIGVLINPFVSNISNYVYLAPQDTSIDNYQVFTFEQNQNTWLYGGEITFHYHPHFLHNLHLESNASYLFVEDQIKRPISFIPQPRITSLLTYDMDTKKSFFPSSIAVQHSFFGEQSRVIRNEISSPSYQLLDIGVSWLLTVKSISGKFKIGIRNLTNSEYIDHLSELKPLAIPNPGRNIYFAIKLNINSKISNK